MAKRHTDTVLFDQQWFQRLHPIYKCFWFYICAKCDHAGIWEVNMPLARFTIDPDQTAGITLDESILEVFEGRVTDLGNDKWYITKYVMFHHGEVLTPNNNFHISIIKSLQRHDLLQENGDGSYAVRSHPAEKKGALTEPKKATPRFKPPGIGEVLDYFLEKKYANATQEAEKFWNFYESKGWMVGKNRMKNWHSSAANWTKKERKQNSRVYIQESDLNKDHGW